jgi:AcrR family transcriptional regulator
MTEKAPPRRGRRPGVSNTRQSVLAAARTRFGNDGFAATTIRAIATDAGVDASQVMQFFRSKDDLFAAVLAVPPETLRRFDEAFAGPDEGLGMRVVLAFLAAWEGPATESDPLMATLRSALANEQARRQLSEFLQSRWTDGALRGDDAVLRVGLALSMLVGVITSRRIIGVPALESATHEQLATHLAPLIQQLLTGRE